MHTNRLLSKTLNTLKLLRSWFLIIPAILPTAAFACRDCPFPLYFASAQDPDVPIPLQREAEPPISPFPLFFRYSDTLFPLLFSAGGSDNPFPLELNVSGPLTTRGINPSNSNVDVAAQITQVNLITLNTPITSVVMVALGQFPGTGWGEAQLLPRVYVVAPVDGIYDFDLVARKPLQHDLAISFRTAVSVWPDVPDNMKGVRVHSRSNAVVKSSTPADVVGFDQTNAVDFKKWIGKKLILNGEIPPTTGEFLLEKDIPSPHRVFKPDSIGDEMFNPERIDIYVDKDMIITAVGRG